MDKLLEMSAKEVSRLEVMQRLSEKRMSQKEAGAILDLSRRQIKRMLKAYRQKGAAGLVSKNRGRKSNNRLAEEVIKRALNLLKTKYKGFGPTLAHEKLVEKDKLKLSDESVRKLMIEEELWKPRKAKKVVIHQLRERRACFGELIQIDGSPHDWFEGRAAACVLLVFIDDATGRLVQLRFVESESFFSYAQAAEDYFRRCGKPVAFYSDRHGIFRVNVPSTGSGEALTQFGRAMQELDTRIITWQEPRTLSKNLTLQFEKVVYQIQTQRPTYSMRQAIVTVCKDAQQNITILYKGKSLPYTIFHKQTKQSEVVHAKNVNQILPPHKPAPDHPWRQGFATPLSKRGSVTTSKSDISILENR